VTEETNPTPPELPPPLTFDPNKRVAIVGTSQSWMLAPFDDETVEIWGVNNAFIQTQNKRKSRWFDIHFIEHRPDGRWYRRWKSEFRGQQVSAYIEELSKLGCPIYMQQAWPEIPNSVRFPIERVINYFGKYITNSIAMQIAYAFTEGFGEIQLWGIDMSRGSEYEYQKPNTEYFIGMGIAFGVKMVVPAESDLLKSNYMYAYEEREKSQWIKKSEVIEKNMKIKMNRTAMEVMQLENELSMKKRELEQHIGARQGISEMRRLWIDDFGNWHHQEDK
jgi:hypothetical protein